MSYDLGNFSLKDMALCSSWLRQCGLRADSMQAAARSAVGYLYRELAAGRTEEPACLLVRFFITQEHRALDDELRAIASRALGSEPAPPSLRCLTLLATAGLLPEWNSVRSSRAHRCIPLAGRRLVERVPMISQLIRQFGIDLGLVLAPAPDLLMEASQRTYNVFYVPDALGSPHIPAQQDFVIPYRVRSVLGVGGMLPSGNLFAVILFTKVPVSRETADLFKVLALSIKAAVLPFDDGRVFAPASAPEERR